MLKLATVSTLALSLTAGAALAQTDITWWHGMGGRNGEVVNEISTMFNEAQSDCAITPLSKGTYEEALSSGIAAFRSGEQPNILQVFDAGAATIISAKGATSPLLKSSVWIPFTSATIAPIALARISARVLVGTVSV